jgi:glycosyltransferase involved in cell wall biosynthesis
MERWTTASADRFVCVSQSVAEFCRHHGFAAEKLVVVPNGVDPTRWNDLKKSDVNPLGLAANRRAIVFLGRLDKQKGLDRFFHELPAVFKALPGHELVLVGDGPQRSTLERLAIRLRMESRIRFLGWQPEPAHLLSAADILILPSRWEGMPNVVLEAMAMGKPVVATQAEGTVELLGIASQEQTAAVGDWAGFRQRLIEIGRNPQLAAELSEKNRARAAQFSIDAMVLRYERLFESITGC